MHTSSYYLTSKLASMGSKSMAFFLLFLVSSPAAAWCYVHSKSSEDCGHQPPNAKGGRHHHRYHHSHKHHHQHQHHHHNNHHHHHHHHYRPSPSPSYKPPPKLPPRGCSTCNPSPTVPALPPPAAPTCSIDALKLGLCLDVLGGLVHVGLGDPVQNTCCPVLAGLLELEAAVCLCTAIRLKLLNINIYIPLALNVLITCGKNPPPGYVCPGP